VPEPPIERFELRLRLDATVSIHDATGKVEHWVKPGSETAAIWSGMPSQTEIVLRYEALSKVAAATLEAVIVQTTEELRKNGLR
jgi:hypothetical protein